MGILIAVIPARSNGCEMCRDAAPNNKTSVETPSSEAGLGFNGSIYFMLAALAGTGVWAGRSIVRTIRDAAPHDE